MVVVLVTGAHRARSSGTFDCLETACSGWAGSLYGMMRPHNILQGTTVQELAPFVQTVSGLSPGCGVGVMWSCATVVHLSNLQWLHAVRVVPQNSAALRRGVGGVEGACRP
jgi:hypothetical protein